MAAILIFKCTEGAGVYSCKMAARDVKPSISTILRKNRRLWTVYSYRVIKKTSNNFIREHYPLSCFGHFCRYCMKTWKSWTNFFKFQYTCILQHNLRSSNDEKLKIPHYNLRSCVFIQLFIDRFGKLRYPRHLFGTPYQR